MSNTFLSLCRFYKSVGELNYTTINSQLENALSDSKFHKMIKEKSNKWMKMQYISRIFKYEKQLKIDEVELKKNKYYYNDLFDKLYDLAIPELEIYDWQMDQIVDEHNQMVIQNN